MKYQFTRWTALPPELLDTLPASKWVTQRGKPLELKLRVAGRYVRYESAPYLDEDDPDGAILSVSEFQD